MSEHLRAYCTSIYCDPNHTPKGFLKEHQKGVYCSDCGHILLWVNRKHKRAPHRLFAEHKKALAKRDRFA